MRINSTYSHLTFFPFDPMNFIVWMEVCDIPGGGDQDHPQEKEMQKGKMVVWGVLKIAEKKREANGKEENKDIPICIQSSKE